MLRIRKFLCTFGASLMTAVLAGVSVQAAPAVMADGQIFDAAWYADQNPDVTAVVGNDEAALYQHYQLHGKEENRTPYDPSLDHDTAQQQALQEMQRRGLSVVTIDGQVLPTGEVTDPAFFTLVQQVIAAVTKPEQTQAEKLRACYDYVMDVTTYKRTYETPTGDWTRQYATDIYATGRGNCYRYAAAFGYLAKGLGFNAIVCTGEIQAARGGVTPHGWVEIQVGDQWLICDPDMQDTRRSTNFYLRTAEEYPVKPLITQQIWELNF